MHNADPHLLLVLLRPVGGTGQGSRYHGDDTEGGEPASGLLGYGPSARPPPGIHSLPPVKRRGRQPRPQGSLHQNRVDRMPEPDPVQAVPEPARRQQSCHPLPKADKAVKPSGLLQAGNVA